MKTQHRLEIRAHRHPITHADDYAATACTCGLRTGAIPKRHAWRAFEEHRTLTGLPGYTPTVRLILSSAF